MNEVHARKKAKKNFATLYNVDVKLGRGNMGGSAWVCVCEGVTIGGTRGRGARSTKWRETCDTCAKKAKKILQPFTTKFRDTGWHGGRGMRGWEKRDPKDRVGKKGSFFWQREHISDESSKKIFWGECDQDYFLWSTRKSKILTRPWSPKKAVFGGQKRAEKRAKKRRFWGVPKNYDRPHMERKTPKNPILTLQQVPTCTFWEKCQKPRFLTFFDVFWPFSKTLKNGPFLAYFEHLQKWRFFRHQRRSTTKFLTKITFAQKKWYIFFGKGSRGVPPHFFVKIVSLIPLILGGAH
jgi:hypothetical protein